VKRYAVIPSLVSSDYALLIVEIWVVVLTQFARRVFLVGGHQTALSSKTYLSHRKPKKAN
jgi:hypothetical protein